MKYNPQIHHRRSIRLKGYDYSHGGAYFITICCHERECRFGKIENDEMILNEYGNIAYNEWVKLPVRFPNFELDVFQIMPNHMHGIIVLNNGQPQGLPLRHPNNMNEQNVGAGFTPAQNDDDILNENAQSEFWQQHFRQSHSGQLQGSGLIGAQVNRAITVGGIVGAYKSLVTNGCLEIFKSKNEMMGKLWQRNYHEHIIRNEQSYQSVADYIIDNPSKWNEDKFYKQ